MFKDGGWVKALLFRKISLYGQSLGRNAFVAELRSAAQVGHLGPHDSRTGRCPHLPSGVLASAPNEPCRAALGRPGGTPGPTWFAYGQVSSPAQRSVSYGPKRTLPSRARPPRWGHLGHHGSRTGRSPHLPSGVLASAPNEPCRAALGRPGGTPGPTSEKTAEGGRPHVGIASSLTAGNCALGDYPFRIRSIGDYALPFLDHDQLPGRNVGKLINLSARPLHLDRISTLLVPQAEGKHQFALR